MDPASKLTRRGTVEGRPFAVFDGLLGATDIARMVQSLDQGSFTHDESARPDTQQFRHWVVNLTPEVARALPLHAPTLTAAALVAGDGSRYRDYRAYCNFASYGDVLLTHTDAQPGTHEMTALWYLCREWNHEWGGETLLFNAQQDAEQVVSPRPGRLLVFDGSILHAGRPPQRICFVPRYTFAYKLERY